jgi:hypothetical protein
MRTRKLLPIIASIIASGLLVLATTTSNPVFALSISGTPTGSGTSASSFIGQVNDQKSFCIAGTSNTNSCNQAASNTNLANSVSAALGGSDPNGGGTSASSSIGQANHQNGFCLAGVSNTNSCNQAASNTNTGNAVSSASTQFGGP